MRLSDTQVNMLRGVRDYDNSHYFVRGASAYGGANGTRASLQRLGLLDGSMNITASGRLALEEQGYPEHVRGTLRAAHRRQFQTLVGRLNSLLDEVRKDVPEAQFYLANDLLHLMSGPPHEGLGESHPERSVESVRLNRSDGGDW